MLVTQLLISNEGLDILLEEVGALVVVGLEVVSVALLEGVVEAELVGVELEEPVEDEPEVEAGVVLAGLEEATTELL